MTLRRPPLSAFCGFAFLVLAAGAVAASPPPSVILLEPVRVELTAGEARNLEIDLGGALETGFLYKAELPPTEISRDAVSLGFMVPGEADAPLEGERVALARRGSSLGLRVVAGRCCGGTERRLVELLPPPGSRTGKGPVWPVHLPVEVVVSPDSGACRRDWMSLLVGIVGGLLGVYVLSMKEQSHFLSRRKLASRIEALGLEETGDARKRKTGEVLALVKQELTPWRRTRNWLRSNPLIIGLPGRAYYETVEIILPWAKVQRPSVVLYPARELHLDVEKHPERAEGRLFASSWKGLSLFTVPFQGRVGVFVLERQGGGLPRKILCLTTNERLLRQEWKDAAARKGRL